MSKKNVHLGTQDSSHFNLTRLECFQAATEEIKKKLGIRTIGRRGTPIVTPVVITTFQGGLGQSIGVNDSDAIYEFVSELLVDFPAEIRAEFNIDSLPLATHRIRIFSQKNLPDLSQPALSLSDPSVPFLEIYWLPREVEKKPGEMSVKQIDLKGLTAVQSAREMDMVHHLLKLLPVVQEINQQTRPPHRPKGTGKLTRFTVEEFREILNDFVAAQQDRELPLIQEYFGQFFGEQFQDSVSRDAIRCFLKDNGLDWKEEVKKSQKKLLNPA